MSKEDVYVEILLEKCKEYLYKYSDDISNRDISRFEGEISRVFNELTLPAIESYLINKGIKDVNKLLEKVDSLCKEFKSTLPPLLIEDKIQLIVKQLAERDNRSIEQATIIVIDRIISGFYTVMSESISGIDLFEQSERFFLNKAIELRSKYRQESVEQIFFAAQVVSDYLQISMQVNEVVEKDEHYTACVLRKLVDCKRNSLAIRALALDSPQEIYEQFFRPLNDFKPSNDKQAKICAKNTALQFYKQNNSLFEKGYLFLVKEGHDLPIEENFLKKAFFTYLSHLIFTRVVDNPEVADFVLRIVFFTLIKSRDDVNINDSINREAVFRSVATHHISIVNRDMRYENSELFARHKRNNLYCQNIAHFLLYEAEGVPLSTCLKYHVIPQDTIGCYQAASLDEQTALLKLLEQNRYVENIDVNLGEFNRKALAQLAILQRDKKIGKIHCALYKRSLLPSGLQHSHGDVKEKITPQRIYEKISYYLSKCEWLSELIETHPFLQQLDDYKSIFQELKEGRLVIINEGKLTDYGSALHQELWYSNTSYQCDGMGSIYTITIPFTGNPWLSVVLELKYHLDIVKFLYKKYCDHGQDSFRNKSNLTSVMLDEIDSRYNKLNAQLQNKPYFSKVKKLIKLMKSAEFFEVADQKIYRIDGMLEKLQQRTLILWLEIYLYFAINDVGALLKNRHTFAQFYHQYIAHPDEMETVSRLFEQGDPREKHIVEVRQEFNERSVNILVLVEKLERFNYTRQSVNAIIKLLDPQNIIDTKVSSLYHNIKSQFAFINSIANHITFKNNQPILQHHIDKMVSVIQRITNAMHHRLYVDHLKALSDNNSLQNSITNLPNSPRLSERPTFPTATIGRSVINNETVPAASVTVFLTRSFYKGIRNFAEQHLPAVRVQNLPIDNNKFRQELCRYLEKEHVKYQAYMFTDLPRYKQTLAKSKSPNELALKLLADYLKVPIEYRYKDNQQSYSPDENANDSNIRLIITRQRGKPYEFITHKDFPRVAQKLQVPHSPTISPDTSFDIAQKYQQSQILNSLKHPSAKPSTYAYAAASAITHFKPTPRVPPSSLAISSEVSTIDNRPLLVNVVPLHAREYSVIHSLSQGDHWNARTPEEKEQYDLQLQSCISIRKAGPR